MHIAHTHTYQAIYKIPQSIWVLSTLAKSHCKITSLKLFAIKHFSACLSLRINIFIPLSWGTCRSKQVKASLFIFMMKKKSYFFYYILKSCFSLENRNSSFHFGLYLSVADCSLLWVIKENRKITTKNVRITNYYENKIGFITVYGARGAHFYESSG